MNNPCKQCLVSMMCHKFCDNFLTFISTNLRPSYHSYYGYGGEKAFSAIAEAIRERRIHLYDNDTRWGIVPYDKYK